MIFLLLYLVVGVITFFSTSVFASKRMAEKASRHNDMGDLFLLGLLVFLVSSIWPVSIFGLAHVWISNYYKMRADREREITEELSRG